MAFYNYSSHGDVSIGYVQIILPIPFKKTHSKYNDADYSVERYTKGAELITSKDTVNFMYSPLNLRTQFFTLIKKRNLGEMYSQYIFLFQEPYKWGSLFQMDSLFLPFLKDMKEIRYLDTSGTYLSMRDIKFEIFYFFDGKQVSKESKEFFQKMQIELPPPVKTY